MTGDVIKSFLVGLGFDVDDSSLAKFNKSIASATLRVTALYGAINTAATGIVFGISKISESFENLGYEFKILAPAINKALILKQEMMKAYAATGVNLRQVIQDSVKLNISLTKTKYAFDAIYKSVGSRFFGLLTKQSDLFRQKIYANMPKIQNTLEKLVKFIFKALEATTALGSRLWSILTRVYDFFVTLDKATDGWSTRILAVIAAWKLLNLSFLATPLGLLLTGFVALLALWDDFQTFMEGGQSLFNWGKVLPIIEDITAAFESLWGVVKSVFETFNNLFLVIYRLLNADFSGALTAWGRAGESIIAIFENLWGVIKNLGGSLGSIAGAVASLFGGGDDNKNVAANVQNSPGGVPKASPVGSTVQNAQTNQNVQQQTNINVTGSADAGAVGKAVSSEQSKVNFDMARNMKGAVR